MNGKQSDIPPERERQFSIIEQASRETLRWAVAEQIPLERIEPVVPFVETDFSLHAWLFLDTEDRVQGYRADGTLDDIEARFKSDLSKAGYPPEWWSQVECHFGSKEVVDRDYQGSYFYFLR